MRAKIKPLYRYQRGSVQWPEDSRWSLEVDGQQSAWSLFPGLAAL